MNTPDSTALLAEQAQRAAKDAVAGVILRTEGWTSPAAAVRAARSVELAVHAEVLGPSAGPGKRASRGTRSASPAA